jgi:drug/metabolite transporter (DMT)-like permease
VGGTALWRQEQRSMTSTALTTATTAPPAQRAPLRAALDPLVASCLWGGMYVVSRASFGAIPPVTLAALRVVIGGLTLAAALFLLRARRADSAGAPVWRRADQLRALGCGAVVAACILMQFLGTDLASAHDGALLTTVTPTFIVPLAWALLGERPTKRIAGGMLLALAGVVIVVVVQTAGTGSAAQPVSLLGDALLLGSAFCWALFTVLGAPLTRRFSALAASTAATLWSILFIVPLVPIELLSLSRDQHTPISLTPLSVAAVLYLGWGATALAWLLWYRGVARLAAGVAAVYFFAQPLVGGVLSGLLLHESLSPGFWLGGGVLAGGILLVSWAPRGHGAPPPAAQTARTDAR